MLLCEPGPSNLSHEFHFAPRVANMLCSRMRSGMILSQQLLQDAYVLYDINHLGLLSHSQKNGLSLVNKLSKSLYDYFDIV